MTESADLVVQGFGVGSALDSTLSQQLTAQWKTALQQHNRSNSVKGLTISLTVNSSQCSMNSARLSMVCVISGMFWSVRACLRLVTKSSWWIGRSSIQHDTNAALNSSLNKRHKNVQSVMDINTLWSTSINNKRFWTVWYDVIHVYMHTVLSPQ